MSLKYPAVAERKEVLKKQPQYGGGRVAAAIILSWLSPWMGGESSACLPRATQLPGHRDPLPGMY